MGEPTVKVFLKDGTEVKDMSKVELPLDLEIRLMKMIFGDKDYVPVKRKLEDSEEMK